MTYYISDEIENDILNKINKTITAYTMKEVFHRNKAYNVPVFNTSDLMQGKVWKKSDIEDNINRLERIKSSLESKELIELNEEDFWDFKEYELEMFLEKCEPYQEALLEHEYNVAKFVQHEMKHSRPPLYMDGTYVTIDGKYYVIGFPWDNDFSRSYYYGSDAKHLVALFLNVNTFKLSLGQIDFDHKLILTDAVSISSSIYLSATLYEIAIALKSNNKDYGYKRKYDQYQNIRVAVNSQSKKVALKFPSSDIDASEIDSVINLMAYANMIAIANGKTAEE